MTWASERDLLIVQTMAFVQSVTGKKPETDARIQPLSSSALGELDRPELAAVAVETPLKPAAASPVRAEIESRVAAFRAHQQRFDRERDRHYNSVLTEIRATITAPAGASTP